MELRYDGKGVNDSEVVRFGEEDGKTTAVVKSVEFCDV